MIPSLSRTSTTIQRLLAAVNAVAGVGASTWRALLTCIAVIIALMAVKAMATIYAIIFIAARSSRTVSTNVTIIFALQTAVTLPSTVVDAVPWIHASAWSTVLTSVAI